MKKDFFVKLFFYILIGLVGVIVDTTVFTVFFNLILHPVFGSVIWHIGNAEIYVAATTAAVIGGIAGFVNNFLLNEFLVYKKKDSKKETFLRFIKYFITIILGTFIIGKIIIFNIAIGLIDRPNISNLIAIATGTLINYPINYFWTWGSFSIRDKFKKRS